MKNINYTGQVFISYDNAGGWCLEVMEWGEWVCKEFYYNYEDAVNGLAEFIRGRLSQEVFNAKEG
jgi:hypothetical protein